MTDKDMKKLQKVLETYSDDADAGMTDEDDMKKGERSLRQMLRAREEAKVEQILEEYKERVRTGAFSKPQQEWPKLKFSRTMGHKAMVGGEDNRSRPSTPRAAQQPQQQEAAR